MASLSPPVTVCAVTTTSADELYVGLTTYRLTEYVAIPAARASTRIHHFPRQRTVARSGLPWPRSRIRRVSSSSSRNSSSGVSDDFNLILGGSSASERRRRSTARCCRDLPFCRPCYRG